MKDVFAPGEHVVTVPGKSGGYRILMNPGTVFVVLSFEEVRRLGNFPVKGFNYLRPLQDCQKGFNTVYGGFSSFRLRRSEPEKGIDDFL